LKTGTLRKKSEGVRALGTDVYVVVSTHMRMNQENVEKMQSYSQMNAELKQGGGFGKVSHEELKS